MTRRYVPDSLTTSQGGRQSYGPDNMPKLPGQLRRAVSEGEYVSAGRLVRRMGPAGRILRQFFTVFPPRGSIESAGRRYYPSDALISGVQSHGEFWERVRLTISIHRPATTWQDAESLRAAWALIERPRLPQGAIWPAQAWKLNKGLKAFLDRQVDSETILSTGMAREHHEAVTDS